MSKGVEKRPNNEALISLGTEIKKLSATLAHTN
jgi:hypothetical protein